VGGWVGDVATDGGYVVNEWVVSADAVVVVLLVLFHVC
jgi:ABC-type methionine transport system permease subunit